MIGNNEIRLNKATMLEAIQLWLDKKFAVGQAPVAFDVMADGDCFSVDVKSKDEDDEN